MAKKDEESDEMESPSTLDKLTAVVQNLALIVAKQMESGGNSTRSEELMLKLTEAMERISETSLQGSKMIADETRRAFRPSNEQVPMVSVFDRRGVLLDDYQKPKLKCLMMIPWLVEWESCTREEVELLNLLEPGQYSLKRGDNTKIDIKILVDYRVGTNDPNRLVIQHETAFNNDNFKNHLPLNEMIRFILRQHDPEVWLKAKAVLTDEEEEMMIEAGQLSVSV